jgi:hypothetical protein
VRRLTLLAFLVCSLLAPSAARADVNIADVLGPTKVSAYGGRVVWSAFNPANQENRLMARLGDGPVEAVPIPPTPTPFEADLGPGPDGHVVAVYPRCEPGCDIWSFDFATGREAKLPGASSPRFDEFPAAWPIPRRPSGRTPRRASGPATGRRRSADQRFFLALSTSIGPVAEPVLPARSTAVSVTVQAQLWRGGVQEIERRP